MSSKASLQEAKLLRVHLLHATHQPGGHGYSQAGLSFPSRPVGIAVALCVCAGVQITLSVFTTAVKGARRERCETQATGKRDMTDGLLGEE